MNQQELIQRIRSMRKELADWHSTAGERVSQYTQQLTDLQDELLREMASLRNEVSSMRTKVQTALQASERTEAKDTRAALEAVGGTSNG